MSERSRYVPPPVGRSNTGPLRPAAAETAPTHGTTTPGPATAAHERPQPAATENAAQTASPKRKRRGNAVGKGRGLARKLFFVAWAVITLVVAVGAAGLWRQTKQSALAVDSGKYQAVFLTSGQVYFGKLHTYNNESIKLTDVYYLQTQAGEEAGSENPQQAAAEGPNVQLVKLGNEIHGPQDEMLVFKNQILFYENLKPDSQVAQSIEKHKSSK